MRTKDLERDVDLFLDFDLAWRAAAKVGINPNNPYLELKHFKMDETEVTFVSSGKTIKLADLGLGNLQRVDVLFTEYVSRLHPAFRESVEELGRPGGSFSFEPGDPRWFFKESAKKDLFQRWGNQMASGANRFVL